MGPTTVYAFMQAMGMVNDHAPRCSSYRAATEARQRFNDEIVAARRGKST